MARQTPFPEQHAPFRDSIVVLRFSKPYIAILPHAVAARIAASEKNTAKRLFQDRSFGL
jgi:hypothetical protein